MSNSVPIRMLQPPESENRDLVLVHLVIDPDQGRWCKRIDDGESTNNPHKVTCDECRRIWVTGSLEP